MKADDVEDQLGRLTAMISDQVIELVPKTLRYILIVTDGVDVAAAGTLDPEGLKTVCSTFAGADALVGPIDKL